MSATADAHWHWQLAVPLAGLSMNNWLQDSGSLTARLRLCCQQFRVQLLNTRADVPFTASQARRLGDTHGYCREVLLLCDEQPWIYASSLYSSAALKAVPALGGLGQQALGELLFDNPQLVRGAFEFAQLTALEFQQLQLSLSATLSQPQPAAGLRQSPTDVNIEFDTDTEPLPWARRSVLAIPKARVLVSELFLPAATAYRE